MRINAETELYGIIGYPVKHSISPEMHNAAFNAVSYNAVYLAFEVPKEKLAEAVGGIRSLGVKGVSVTIPHKVSVMQFIDEIDPLAQRVGAVNTIKNENGLLKGYNSDVYGAYLALKNKTIIEGMKVAVLGSGGAARAVAFAVADLGKASEVFIVSRNEKTREELAVMLRNEGRVVRVFGWDLDDIRRAVEEANIVVNTTPLGMKPYEDQTPVPPDFIREDHVIFDVVYVPKRTLLLKESLKRGATIIEGIDMLVNQALIQFKIWTGLEPPREVYWEVALELLT